VENFGLQDKLEINNRIFYVQTGALIEHNRILSDVFEQGLFLLSRELQIQLRKDRAGQDYEFLQQVTETVHQAVIDELESLYLIKEKLKRYRHPKSHYYLGVLFLKRNLHEEAIQEFKIAVEQDYTFADAFIALGVAYLKSRKFVTAKETFKTAMTLTGKFPDFLNYYGLSLLFLDEFDDAMAQFKEAIRINPNYLEAQFNLGVALYKSALQGANDPDAVAVPARVSIYLKQLCRLPKYDQFTWQKEFNNLLHTIRESNHSLIIPELESFQLKLVDLASDRDKIYEFYLRFLFGGKELTIEQINQYQQYFNAVNGNLKSYPDYWNDLGIYNLIKSRGLLMKAVSEFEKALALAPNFEEARKNLNAIRSHEKGFMILLRAILK
jgi:tetratricopeptide (TPR) repeat protein